MLAGKPQNNRGIKSTPAKRELVNEKEDMNNEKSIIILKEILEEIRQLYDSFNFSNCKKVIQKKIRKLKKQNAIKK